MGVPVSKLTARKQIFLEMAGEFYDSAGAEQVKFVSNAMGWLSNLTDLIDCCKDKKTLMLTVASSRKSR